MFFHSHWFYISFISPRFLVGSFERHFDSRLGLEPWQTGIFGFYKAGGLAKICRWRWSSCWSFQKMPSRKSSFYDTEMKHLPGTSERASEQSKVFSWSLIYCKALIPKWFLWRSKSSSTRIILHGHGESLGHLTCISLSYEWGRQWKMSNKNTWKTYDPNSVWFFENIWMKFTGFNSIPKPGHLRPAHLTRVWAAAFGSGAQHRAWGLDPWQNCALEVVTWKGMMENIWFHMKFKLKREYENFKKKKKKWFEQSVSGSHSILTFLH